MESVNLLDLLPALAAFFGPLLLFVVAIMRYQHVDNTKTRDLIDQSNKENRELIKEVREENRELIKEVREETRDLIDQSNKENRELIKEVREEVEKNREKIEASHRETVGSLADIRERVAHIEGCLRLNPPPPRRAEGADGEAEAA